MNKQEVRETQGAISLGDFKYNLKAIIDNELPNVPANLPVTTYLLKMLRNADKRDMFYDEIAIKDGKIKPVVHFDIPAYTRASRAVRVDSRIDCSARHRIPDKVTLREIILFLTESPVAWKNTPAYSALGSMKQFSDNFETFFELYVTPETPYLVDYLKKVHLVEEADCLPPYAITENTLRCLKTNNLSLASEISGVEYGAILILHEVWRMLGNENDFSQGVDFVNLDVYSKYYQDLFWTTVERIKKRPDMEAGFLAMGWKSEKGGNYADNASRISDEKRRSKTYSEDHWQAILDDPSSSKDQKKRARKKLKELRESQ